MHFITVVGDVFIKMFPINIKKIKASFKCINKNVTDVKIADFII